MSRISLSLCAVTLVALSLGGCSDTRNALGLTNVSPDEFAVVDHPPLSMPPDFNLQPPRPGAESPIGENPSEKAARALYGEGTMQLVPQQGVSSLKTQQLTPAEQALIVQSGSDKADPTIRSALKGDSAREVTGSRKLIDHLLFWKEPKQTGAIVDPIAEAARLKSAKEQGQPVTTGATTAIDRGRETTLQ